MNKRVDAMERLLESKMPEEVNEVVDADGEESP
jgi:hypothetical protein